MILCVECGCELFGVGPQAKRCEPCKLARKQAAGKAWYEANREAVLVRSRAKAKANPHIGRAAMKAFRAAHPEKNREAQRRSKRRQYGIIDATGEAKTGACFRAGCEYVGPLHFDHWHDGPRKGYFRGWLCPLCNKGAGMFQDSPAALRAMADYIELAAGVGWPLDTGQPVG